MMHPDMRPKPKDWNGQDYHWIEVKEDGWRMTLYVDRDGSHRFIGRKPEIDRYCDVSSDLCEKFDRVPPGTIVDGELYVPGEKATFVPSALKIHDARMVFCAFAMPWYCGVDNRSMGRDPVRHHLEGMGFSTPELFLSSVPVTAASLRAIARETGVEGFVLKEAHYHSWYRVKRNHTCDLIACGWTPGKGKHLGRIGSISATTWERWSDVDDEEMDASVATVGGISDELRQLDFEKHWYGRVIEVEYDEIGAGGRLKFARFVRFRDDKPREECVL